MGNEGSVPEGHEAEEEFEYQARAPPSYSNPTNPTNQQRSGGRMMNALRREKSKQNAAGGVMGSNTTNGLSTGGSSYVTAGDGGNRTQQSLYPDEVWQNQQNHFQQHSQSHNSGNQQAWNPSSSQQRNNSSVVSQDGGGSYQSPTRVKKTGMNFRPSVRGAAIINSMKSLSISSAIQKAADKAKLAKGGGINDWATKWDEDDDSDDDDENVETNQKQPLHPPLDQAAVPPSAAVVAGSPWSEAQSKAHCVTATPDSDIRPMPTSSGGSNSWEPQPIQRQPQDKPNVQMFLPLLRVLGKGSFGKVVLVQKRQGKEKGALFAMKILRKSHLVRRRQIERTRTERKVLSIVNHPFIMKLHYAFQSPDKLYLVLDYCPGGELFFHLSRFRRFPERVARFYAAELLLALGHLHKRGIIYRDLKPENVLLDADGHIKLGDFGLAKAGIKDACEGATSMCGTPEYMAPEVLAQQGHGFCVDYWGLGMLVYEMMTGLPPWYTTDRAKLFRRLKSAPLDVPSYFSQSATACVGALLERNPRRRLGVTGVRAAMEHDFFRSISWRALYGRRVEAPIRPCEGWNPPSIDSDGKAMTAPEPHVAPGEGTDPINLDAATANFDNTFTRMPVETEDNTGNHSDEGDLDELNEDTFVGFTFDDKERDDFGVAIPARQRTHHYNLHATNEPSSGVTRNID
ncbi:unnamed protein product [Cylindrotheca closterium]|uniref:Protein kinase domain-containing protein n=1 Tax=Cylindrotheca closterium TaxID=2856 RepID=A0AAD2FR26_9STRA|nr:unnamed protein product [Cylindrotheca closterium]